MPEPTLNGAAAAAFIGNRPVVERLEEKVRSKRLPHAMIFAGPEGVGKRTFALRLAQRLHCPSARDGAPCGGCSSCRRIETGVHPDVSLISIEEDASQIKIEQVRALRAAAALGAIEGRVRIFIIDPADAMNPSAANAMLKLLEEPPEDTCFLLITAKAHELPVTVRSRCQIHRFAPLALEDVRAAGVDDEVVVRWSAGSIGRARVADPAALRAARDQVFRFLERAMTAAPDELAPMLAASAELGRSKHEHAALLRMAGVVVSDLIALALGRDSTIVNIDLQDRLTRLKDRGGLERLVQVGEFLKFVEVHSRFHLNRQMTADLLLLALNPSSSEILDDKAWESR